MKNNNPSIKNKMKANSSFILIGIILLALLFGLGGFYVGKASMLTTQKSNDMTQIDNEVQPQTDLDPILSPSSDKRISFNEGNIMLFDSDREWNIGKYDIKSFLKSDMDVVWSPDESRVSIETANPTARLNTIYQMPGVDIVFQSIGQYSIFWYDKNTAYISYQHHIPYHRISKLIFTDDRYNPEEAVVYEEQRANAFYAFVPASVSPDGMYIILEQRYEGLPILYVLNTSTRNVKQLNYSGDSYVIGNNPNYQWTNYTITFRGGRTENGSYSKYMNSNGQLDESMFEDVSINIFGF